MIVEDRISQFEDPAQKACLVVLAEDLSSLIEECEDYLIDKASCSERVIASFQSRSVTILEEVVDILLPN